MKRIILIILVFFPGMVLRAQTQAEPVEGAVSYITAQSVYVKFSSTENISAGDTLFVKQGDKLIPALVVKDLSSTSCVCTPLSSVKLAVSDKIRAKQNVKRVAEEKPKQEQPSLEVKPQKKPEKNETETGEKINQGTVKQLVTGRLTAASYSNLSNTPGGNSQRMRYTLSLDAKNLGNSKLSAETYVSFVARDKQWDTIKKDIYKGLKIYSLALNFDFSPRSRLSFGRKINPRISNVGPIDGLQYEFRLNSITTGLITGFRPDMVDFSPNSKLLQYGGYIGHDYSKKNRFMQSTLAFIEQQNSGKTDRRFAYLQHSNSLVRNLYFFGSAEIDMYRKVADSISVDNKPRLTNTYLSLRYRVYSTLSFSLSYSARQNILYYETYKNYIDKLLDDINQQGYMFQFNYQPFKKISLGASAGYRTQNHDPKPSKNVYSYLTFSQLPLINASATLSATVLETGYLKGNIYSLGFNRDLIPGKLFAGLTYRYVDYTYFYSDVRQKQHMGELDLSWRILQKLSLSVYAEGTFEKKNNYNQVYLSLSKSF